MQLTPLETIVVKLVLALFLVLVNGFFVAAELALVKIRETQLDMVVARGQKRARLARQLKSNLNAAIGATQLGITLASLGLGWLVDPLVRAMLSPVLAALHVHEAAWVHSVVFFVAFATMSFMLIIVGEMAPKAIAIQKTLPVALWVAVPLAGFRRLATPFIAVINHCAQWLVRRLGIDPLGTEGLHSEEELRLLFLGSRSASTSTALGRDIVLNALELRGRVVREVMRPRREITPLDTEATIAECLSLAEKTRFSRFPICKGGDLDRTLGVIHIKDLYALRLKVRSGMGLLPAARKIIYVPETARLEKLLQLFLDRRLHLAIVVDEYGGTVGMVTLENILEELVGQIQDEFDQEKPLASQVDAATWELAGELPLHELSELVGIPLREEGITTTSGLVTHRLGGFPHLGDHLDLGTHDLTVTDTDGLRVRGLRLRKKPLPDGQASSTAPSLPEPPVPARDADI